VLRKPFDLETLSGAVSAELGRARTTARAAGERERVVSGS